MDIGQVAGRLARRTVACNRSKLDLGTGVRCGSASPSHWSSGRLISEDLQNGCRFGVLMVENPFSGA
jgi:hypothetical protein